MAGSSNSSWVKGFSSSPYGAMSPGKSLGELLAEVGDERLPYPLDDPAAPNVSRTELLVRVLRTRAIADGDMTAIKLLLELLSKPSVEDDEREVRFTPQDLEYARELLRRWQAQAVAVRHIASEAEEASGGEPM